MKQEPPLEIPIAFRDLFLTAQKFSTEGNLEKTAEILGILAAKNPGNGPLLAVYANALTDIGMHTKALYYFQQVVAKHPESELYSFGLFHCLLDLDRKEEALAEMNRFMSVGDSSDYREIMNGMMAKNIRKNA